jgi:hypothetical protein
MLSNTLETSDWYYLVPAAILVDITAIFLSRYPGNDPYFKVDSLNLWYDSFGIFALTSDISSILIGIAISRLIYTSLGLKNIMYFFIILFIFQVCHDLFFYLAVILQVKEGENKMIDVFKLYAKEDGGKILGADALLIFFTIFFASFFKMIPYHYTVLVSLITIYAGSYIMFTRNPSQRKSVVS